MRILIGNPAYRQAVGDGLERYMLGAGMRFPWSLLKRESERPRYAMFPFFLAYAAALLENRKFDVSVVDAVPLNLSEADFDQRVADAAPHVIVLEPNTAVIDRVLQQARRLRDRTGARIVLVGSHASACASQILADNAHVEFIVVGEYELGLLNLLEACRAGEGAQGLTGIVHRRSDGSIASNGRAPVIADLNALPPPARHLFPAYFDRDMTVYRDGFCQLAPAFHMHASRGCPFRCNFCVWVQTLYENGKQRHFSPARIADEMEMLVRDFRAREIYFDDDNFTGSRAHVSAMCSELIRRDKKIRWSAMTDAIALNEGLLETMAAAGCIGIKFGLDSADAEILKTAQKPLKVSRVAELVEKAKRLGIKTHMTVVFGLNGETRKSLAATFQFCCDLDVDSIQFSLATPCPGTTLYDELNSQGRISAKSWDEFDGANRSVITYGDISQTDLELFQAQSHSRWLRAKIRKPAWVLRQIRYIARVAEGQGIRGVVRRFRRGARLLIGDAARVGDGLSRTLRW